MSRSPDTADGQAKSQTVLHDASIVPCIQSAAQPRNQSGQESALSTKQQTDIKNQQSAVGNARLSNRCKEPRLGLMDLPLELRQRVYGFLIPEDPRILCTTHLTVQLAFEKLSDFIKNPEILLGDICLELEELPKKPDSRRLRPWQCIIASGFPAELLLNKTIIHEASCVFIRRSIFVFERDVLDGVCYHRLVSSEDPGLVGVQEYLDWFPGNQGYANVRCIQFEDEQLWGYDNHENSMKRLIEKCTGLREVELQLCRDPGIWTLEGMNEEEDRRHVEDDIDKYLGLPKLLKNQRPLIVTISFVWDDFPQDLPAVKSYTDPWFSLMYKIIMERGTIHTLRCAYARRSVIWERDVWKMERNTSTSTSQCY